MCSSWYLCTYIVVYQHPLQEHTHTTKLRSEIKWLMSQISFVNRSEGLIFPSICCNLSLLSQMESHTAESGMFMCWIAFGIRPVPHSTQLQLSFHNLARLCVSASDRSCITLRARTRLTNSSFAFILTSELLCAVCSCWTHDHSIAPPLKGK